MEPWISTYEGSPAFTVTNFIAQLRKAFQNLELERQAVDKLHKGKRSVIYPVHPLLFT